MKIVTIQPANTPDGSYRAKLPLPYPYHVDSEGRIQRQEVWRGDPHSLIGFQREAGVQEVEVFFDEFWADPESVVGMFPVFSAKTDGGGFNGTYSLSYPIMSVKAHEGGGALS